MLIKTTFASILMPMDVNERGNTGLRSQHPLFWTFGPQFVLGKSITALVRTCDRVALATYSIHPLKMTKGTLAASADRVRIGWQKLDMHCARDVSASISRKHRNEIIMDLYGLNPWEFSRQKSGFYCATFLFAPTTTRTHRLPANNPSFIGRSNFILRGKFPPSPPWNYGNYCQL